MKNKKSNFVEIPNVYEVIDMISERDKEADYEILKDKFLEELEVNYYKYGVNVIIHFHIIERKGAKILAKELRQKGWYVELFSCKICISSNKEQRTIWERIKMWLKELK